MMEGDDGRKAWGIALSYSAIGIELAIGIVGGYLVGAWLDTRYGTAPYLMLLMVSLGTATGFISLAHTTARISRQLEASDDDDGREDKSDD